LPLQFVKNSDILYAVNSDNYSFLQQNLGDLSRVVRECACPAESPKGCTKDNSTGRVDGVEYYIVPIHNYNMGTVRFLFINEQFLSGSRPHKGLWRGIFPVCRNRKPAENADKGKKGHLWMETIYSFRSGMNIARHDIIRFNYAPPRQWKTTFIGRNIVLLIFRTRNVNKKWKSANR
jgi:hypothetical protein